MDFALSSEQQALLAEIIEFAQANLNEGLAERDKAGVFPKELWLKCGQQLLQGLSIAPEYGGKGLSPLDTMLAFEALGYGCEDQGLAFAIGGQLFACTIPIWLHGSASQKEAFLPKMCQGALIATNAMTEPQGGSAAFHMESRATATKDGYLLDGYKSYCANAPVADLCLAYLPTNPEKGFFGGISAFLLKKSKHAFVVTNEMDKMGLRTCLSGQILLKNVTVTPDCLLGKEGAGALIFTQSMQWERIGLSALHLGSMKRLIEHAVAFVNNRKPGGTPLSTYQAISHQLAEMQVQLEVSRWIVYQAAWSLGKKQKVNYNASVAKLFTSEAYKHMCMQLIQIYGGAGYGMEHEASRSFRDAIASTLYSGTSEIQKHIIAKSIKLNT